MGLVNIIGCGESAKHWDGSGDSIGVNDAFKWGHQLQRLVLLDSPHGFEPERLRIIKKTNAQFNYTCVRQWSGHEFSLNNLVVFDYYIFQDRVVKSKFQTSRTSPFCAMSIAYNLGYDEIVLWGADFKTHPTWNMKNPNMPQEIKNYQSFASQLKNQGIMVYTSEPGILNLPVYEKQIA